MEKIGKKIQSYIYTEKFGDFFVSTCYRRASTPEEMHFYETFAWKLEDKKRTDWVVEHAGHIKDHYEICEQLRKTGEYSDTE